MDLICLHDAGTKADSDSRCSSLTEEPFIRWSSWKANWVMSLCDNPGDRDIANTGIKLDGA